VTYVNLDEIINIEKKSVEVYKDKTCIPPVGHKLNRPALIKLFDFEIKISKEETLSTKERKLKKI
jgi:hypothetical protein